MKKKFLFLINIILASLILLSNLCACFVDNFYHYEGFLFVDYWYYKKFCVICYDWNGQEQTRRIVIPEEYEGHKITQIGAAGYLCNFAFNMPDEYNGCNRISTMPTGPVTEEWTESFTIVLSKNIIVLNGFLSSNYCQYYQNEANEVIKLNCTFVFECDSENPKFYAKDGVLYNKADDTPAQFKDIGD